MSKGDIYIKDEHKFPIIDTVLEKKKDTFLNLEEANNLQDMINYAASINVVDAVEDAKKQGENQKNTNNTNEKLDYGYFAYASFNFTKRFGCKVSYYEGQRDLSNGLELGAWKEWGQNVGNSVLSLNNRQMTVGIYLKIN